MFNKTVKYKKEKSFSSYLKIILIIFDLIIHLY